MVEAHPETYQPLFLDEWLVGVKVALDTADAAQIGALLDAARVHALRDRGDAEVDTAPVSDAPDRCPQAEQTSNRDERRRAARARALATFRSTTPRTHSDEPARSPKPDHRGHVDDDSG